ncbi:MAG: hypothetical protein HYX20_03385 [Candidatus Yanofskybacteria bacterium]|nr:hypothetical protein [Candidatus Yanofskybacteria bacterium]
MVNCCEKPQFNKDYAEMNKTESGERKKPFFANELWFREDEKNLLQNKLITASVRVGDRTAETVDPKNGYKEGRFIRIKIQKEDKEFDLWQTSAVVYAAEKKTLGEIEPKDLAGTPLKTKTKTELVEKLKRLYGKEFTDDEIVTIVRFEYEDNLKETNDLIRTKALTFAREPKENPENLDFPSFTIPLVEHDYPAKTPIMWNAAYREFHIDAGNIMLVGDPKQCGHILNTLRKDPKYRGGGAGVGFKDEVIPFLDEVEPLAKEIGAVNFVLKNPDGKFRGFNTDGMGYAQGLEEVFKKKGGQLFGKKAVILGAGGAGNAVAFALAEKGMRIVILNRSSEKAKNLANKINNYFNKQDAGELVRFGGEDHIATEVKDADVIINVSTKGSAGELEKYSALAPASLPANAENIQKNLQLAAQTLSTIPRSVVISDIVLGKEPTPLLQTAKDAGFETLDGIPMVINQGVEAFWLLYGKELQTKNITKEQVAEIMKRAASS